MTARSPRVDEFLELTGVSLTAYEDIVRSERVVVLPLYFVTRWVRVLGSEAAWLVMAFRQMAFLNHAAGTWFKVSGAQVANLAALNPDTFWKYLREHRLQAWFVERDNSSPRWLVGGDDRPHRDTNRYRVQRNVPLVPADQAFLRLWLKERAPTPDAAGMFSAIRQALKTPATQLLASDPAAPAPHEAGPLSVETIARQALPEARYTGEAEETLASLCDDLYAHLVPRKDIAVISHYFIREWLPRLGHGLAWIVVYLRDQCFFDPEMNGKARDTIWVNGGLRALADLVGVAQSKTVGKWLRKKSVSKNDRWETAQFVSVLGQRKGFDKQEPQRVDIRVQVALREPLTQEDWVRYRQLLSERNGQADGRGVKPSHTPQGEGAEPSHSPGGEGAEPSYRSGAQGVIPSHREGGEGAIPTIRGDGQGAQPTHMPDGQGASPTGRVGGSGRDSESLTSLLSPINEEKGGKNLISSHMQEEQLQLLELREQTAPILQNAESKVVGVVPSANNWDLRSLLKAGRVVGRRLDEVLAVKPPPAAYVSWYLYAKTQGSIGNAAQFAARRLLDPDGHTGAGRPFDDFAALGPQGVARCLYWGGKLSPYADHGREWKVVLAWRNELGNRVRPSELGLDELVARAAQQEAMADEADETEGEGESEALSEETSIGTPTTDAKLDIPLAELDAGLAADASGRQMSPNQVWQAARGELQLQTGKSAFDTWLRDAVLLDYESGRFVIGVANSYTKDWLEKRLLATVRRTLSGIVGQVIEVEFVVAGERTNHAARAIAR